MNDDLLGALIEVERLKAALAAGPWDAWRNAQAEVEELKREAERLQHHRVPALLKRVTDAEADLRFTRDALDQLVARLRT